MNLKTFESAEWNFIFYSNAKAMTPALLTNVHTFWHSKLFYKVEQGRTADQRNNRFKFHKKKMVYQEKGPLGKINWITKFFNCQRILSIYGQWLLT